MTGRKAAARPAFPEGDWFEALREAVAADAELAVTGRWCMVDLAFAIVDEETILLRVARGKIAEVVPDPDIGASWNVTLRGTHEDWLTFLQPEPPRFYSDLLAMNGRVPSFTVEGDRKGHIQSHIRVALDLGLSKEEILEAIALPEVEIVAFQEGFEAWREVTDAEGIEPTVEAHQGGSGSRQGRGRALTEPPEDYEVHAVRHMRAADAPESTVYTSRRERRSEER